MVAQNGLATGNRHGGRRRSRELGRRNLLPRDLCGRPRTHRAFMVCGEILDGVEKLLVRLDRKVLDHGRVVGQAGENSSDEARRERHHDFGRDDE